MDRHRHRSQEIKSLRKAICSHSHDANLWLLLPEDLMFHIFTFVPPHCLINSVKYVCKLWAAAIATSHFAEACRCFHVRSKPGLYVENCKSRRRSYFLKFKDDVNAQLERIHLGTPKRMGRLVGTCDGILLLLNKARQLFVVNPILKCWLTIPFFPVSPQFRYVHHCCTIARVPHTDKFKVFYVDILEVSGIAWYVFYTLSEPVCNEGNALYWIAKREVIVMDVDKEIIVREYPHPAIDVVKYLWTEDFLSCIVSGNSFLTYKIYILDLDSGKWTLYHEMGPFDYVSACGPCNPKSKSVSFCLWINNQIIFRVGLVQNRSWKIIHFGYNVKTKQLTKIDDVDQGDFEVWPHTNSLVSLPITPA